MFRPTAGVEMALIGLYIEGFLYGLYTAIFTMYLQYLASNKSINTAQNIIYSMSALYILSTAVFVCDIVFAIGINQKFPAPSLLRIILIQSTIFACCDFIAQFILIYRCWIVWGRNTRVVLVPSILSFAFLVIWLVGGTSPHISSDKIVFPYWEYLTSLSSLAMSLLVNALVTGLIVFKISKVFGEVKAISDNKVLAATGGDKLRRVILILIESGMALFSIQLARFVITVMWREALVPAFLIVVAIHEMLNGITPTIIAVRTSMGLSLHHEKSMEEVATESLVFASNHANSVPEIGRISTFSNDIRDDNGIEAPRRNDIGIVET